MNRVVITGLGAVTPIGNNVEDFWQNSKNGNSGIDFIKSMDTSDIEVKVGGEVKDLKLEDYLDKKEIRRLDRFTQYALIASEEAIKAVPKYKNQIDRPYFLFVKARKK